jgi:hypothetical protein
MELLGRALLGLLVIGPIVFIGWRIKRDDAELDPVNDMRSVRRVRIGAISAESLVRIAGRVAPREALVTAPLSGRPCVAYDLEIDLARERTSVRRDSCFTPFYVQDESGRALILPPCLVVVLAERARVESIVRDLPPAVQAQIGEQYEEYPEYDWRSFRVRAVERRIEPGEQLTVVGWARRSTIADDAAAGYRDSSDVVVVESEEGAPLSISDDESLL